jgi:hypothetical protein
MDIQPQAVEATRAKVEGFSCVTVHCHSHADLSGRLPTEARGRVSLVMFNLGYLPGGDHAITTTPASTLKAMDMAMAFLRVGGMLSVVAYRGHAGGQEEFDAVAAWMTQRFVAPLLETPGPVAWVAVQSGHVPHGVATGG